MKIWAIKQVFLSLKQLKSYIEEIWIYETVYGASIIHDDQNKTKHLQIFHL